MRDVIGGPYKVALHLGKWNNHRTPDDGPPDEVIESATWHEVDGAEITDPARIAQLETQVQEARDAIG